LDDIFNLNANDGKGMNKTALIITALASGALFAIAPLLISSGFFSGGWDLTVHLYHALQVSAGIKEGVLYPRWIALSNGGNGAPITIFYSPLFYILNGFVNLIIPDLILSLKVVMFIGFLLSGIVMYLFLRNFCGRTGSLAGGIAYQLLPYHLFDFYLRETLAETFAFFLFPLILHFAYKGARENRISPWIGMAFSYAGLVLTHLVSAYIFSFVIAAYTLFLSIRGGGFRVFMRSIVASLFGLFLSAVYFVPMFLERKFVHIEWLKDGPWAYDRNFLYMKANRLNPFYAQLEQIVLLSVVLVISALVLSYLKKRTRGDFPNQDHLLFFASVFVFSIFISTQFAMPIWRLVPGFSTTLFPWRWLMISTLAIAAMIGISFDLFSVKDLKSGRRILVSTAAFHAILIGNLILSSFYLTVKVPMQQSDLDRIYSKGAELIEYRPIWLVDKKRDFSEERGKTPVVFTKGQGTIEIEDWKSQSRQIKSIAMTSATVRISTFYYPGWTAVVNGKETPIGIEKESGAMLLTLPPGENTVLLEFRDTPLRRTAKWVSILSLVAAMLVLVVDRQKSVPAKLS
jgi:uncharacterized membrane protein